MDLDRDPDEFTNFIDAPEYQEVIRHFAEAIETYQVENNDSNKRVSAEIDRLLSR